MNDLALKAGEAKKQMEKVNPTVTAGKSAEDRKRIPLSVPQRKLEVPEIPGYRLRWLRGTAARLAQAERAGYEFVHEDEVQLNNLALGGDATKAGNSDLGTRVSVIEGSETDGSGQAVRMYLMKQKLEYAREDDAIVQERNDRVRDALVGQMQTGSVGTERSESEEDRAARYVPRTTKIPELFRKKNRPAARG